jgi:hypothetical protein
MSYYIQRKEHADTLKHHRLFGAEGSSSSDLGNLWIVINNLLTKQVQIENEINILKSLVNSKVEFDVDEHFLYIKRVGDDNEYTHIKIAWSEVL